MDDIVLNEHERKAVYAIELGRKISFESEVENGAPKAIIRGRLIRSLMLSLPIRLAENEPARIIPVPGPGISIAYAFIEGRLELDFACAADGEDLPRLSLEYCHIPDKLKLRSARVRHLGFKGSKMSLLLADHSHIGGELDLSDVSPYGSLPGAGGRGLCRFSLRGAEIEDGIDARRATLVSGPKRPDFVKYAKRARYALDLAEARISGDLRLFPDFSAIGGININGAHIEGSVKIHGGYISPEEMFALDACGSTIIGTLAMDSRHKEAVDGLITDSIAFRADGEVRTVNAIIRDGLNLHGAYIQGPFRANNIRVEGDVNISAFEGLMSGSPKIYIFQCSNDFILSGAKVRGDLNLNGAIFDGNLIASGCEIDGHIKMTTYEHPQKKALYSRALAHGCVDLDNGQIKGNLELDGALLKGGLHANGIHISGYARMGFCRNYMNHCFQSEDVIEMNDATIGFDLDMSGASLENEFLAPNLRVGSKLFMCRATSEKEKALVSHDFKCAGRINLSGAIIQSDFNLNGAVLKRGLRFRGGRVESAMIIDISGGELYDTGTKLVKSSIDLANAHAKVISDYDQDGHLKYSDSFALRLEGFTYGRFRREEDEESMTVTEARRAALQKQQDLAAKTSAEAHSGKAGKSKTSGLNSRKWRQWLQLQYENNSIKPEKKSNPYSPDPYNTLFRVMKQNGYLKEADDVLAYKLTIERQRGSHAVRLLLMFFDGMFKHGLAPARGSFWYALYVALVSFIILGFNHSSEIERFFETLTPYTIDSPSTRKGHAEIIPMMVVLAQPPDTLLEKYQPDNPMDALKIYDKNDLTPEVIVCGDRINSFLFALDWIVPIIDMNQSSKCDLSKNIHPLWHFLKAFIILFGWIMTSLTILTWSGVIRRHIEPGN